MSVRPISQSISHSQKQKPVEWISSLIQRYQDQLPTRTGKALDRESRELLNTTHSCIINVSRHHFHLVILALVRVLKAVNASRWTSHLALSQSRLVILQTLLECLQDAQPLLSRNMEREACMKSVLDEMWTIVCGGNVTAAEKATRVVSRVGNVAASVLVSRAERGLRIMQEEDSSEEVMNQAVADVSLMAYVTLELDMLVKFIQMVTALWPPRKEHLDSVCSMIASVIWRWIENFPDQFSTIQHSPQEHVAEVMDTLFIAMNTPELKRRCVCWPVQMMLIAVSPCSLEAIAHADQGGVSLPENAIMKRSFVDMVSSSVHSGNTQNNKSVWSAQLQYAGHAIVNLCKCATYVNPSVFFVFNVVEKLVEYAKAVLATGARCREMDRRVLVDCFVALYRLRFDNDVFRVCLSSKEPLLQLVLVEALTEIANHRQLSWWPTIDLIASRSQQLRALLTTNLERVLDSEPPNAQAHLQLGMSRSWHKVSGRRTERPSSASLGSVSPLSECNHNTILIAIIKLITTNPALLIRKKNTTDDNCIESVVSGLVLLIDHPQLQIHAMQALLALHAAIPEWNSTPQSVRETFFTVSSHMLFSICQKLIHLQVSNAENVISWLQVLMRKRAQYLADQSFPIPADVLDGIAQQSIVKFEVVCFLYLWNSSADLVLCCLSLFGLHAQECAALSGVQIDSSLSKLMAAVPQSTILTAGRIALQKSINRILRSLPHSSVALQEAWHETFRIWEMFTNQLVQGSKDHAEFIDHVSKVTTDSSDGSAIVDAWSSMSAFLCALSHLVFIKEPNHVTTYFSRLLSVLRMDESLNRELMSKCVKEQLSYETDASLDQFLLHTISSNLASNSSNALFVEHVIYILKNILSRRQGMVLRVDSTSEMVGALLQSLSTNERNAQQRMTFTRKLCSLLQVLVSNGSARRLPSSLQQRMLECLSGGINALPPPIPFSVQRIELLLAILDALSRLLNNMSIPVMSSTFNKVFNDLLESFCDSSVSHASPLRSKNPVEEIVNANLAPDLVRRCNDGLLTTLAALVSANPDLGLSRILETSWTGEWRVRGWMIEALCRVVGEHATHCSSGDKQGSQSELLRLLCQQSEDGTLPLVSCLAQSIPGESIDKLCRVCVSAFSERAELGQLIYSVLWAEAESAISPSTLFRGSSFAAKLISWSLRIFGHTYLLQTVRPLLTSIIQKPDIIYELDESSGNGSNEEAIKAIREAAEKAFSLIVSSLPHCPPRFRQVCAVLHSVINTRFPGLGLSALGKILFLRFYNPAIVSPYEQQMCSTRPSRLHARAFTIVSKILQTAANRPATCRDTTLTPFLHTIDHWAQPLNDFLSKLMEDTAEDEPLPSPAPSTNIQLLRNTHSLFLSDKAEVLRTLSFTCAGSSLYSRVDAVLKSLPDQVAVPPGQSDAFDPSLPYFMPISAQSAALPCFAVILRRLQNVEVDTAAKLIADQCPRVKWICLLDGRMCYEPPSLMKLFSAESFAHIDRIVVLNASTQLFNKLHEHFSLLQTLRISFDPMALSLAVEGVPSPSRCLDTPPSDTFEATLVASDDIPVTVRLHDNLVVVSGGRRWGEASVLVTDYYQCSDFEQMELVSPGVLTLVQSDSLVSLRCDAPALLSRLLSMRLKSAREDTGGVLPPLRANSLHLISLSLVHLADPDVVVRSTSYRLLSALSEALQLPTAASLQETPSLLVPWNALRFLQTTTATLVTHEPQLLSLLVPRILDSGSLTLLHALSDSWQFVAQLGEEGRADVFGALSSSTAAGGALGAAIGQGVWPRIGALDNVTLQTLLNRLLFACPLSAALSVVQSACSGGESRLPALIVEKTITQLSSREPRVSLSRLMSFLLVVSFDASITFLDHHVAQLMHIVTCVAGTGVPFLRAATYSLVANIFHAFGSNIQLGLSEEKRRSLALFLRQLANEDTLRLFRIGDLESGQQVVEMVAHHVANDTSSGDRSEDTDYESLAEEEAVPSGSRHSDLHHILNLIITAILDLQRDPMSGGVGPNSRDWLVEWRVIARHYAFEGRGEVQIRSLIAFSCLADTISDQEMKGIVQLLVQVVKRRDSLSSMAGVALSLVRVHTLTASNSPIHRLIFWIAILLFQLENASLYEHGIQLLHANLAHLDHMGVFEHTSLEKLAMEGRSALEWDMKALDQCAGLSFRANFNFAVAGYLLKGLRQPSLSVKVVQLLQLLLRISAKSTQQNAYVLTSENAAFMLALLPFDDKVQSRFRLVCTDRIPAERKVLSAPWEQPLPMDKDKEKEKDKDEEKEKEKEEKGPQRQPRRQAAAQNWPGGEEEEEESKPLLDPAVLKTEQQQALAVTVLAIHARSCPNVDVVLDYLLEAVTIFPAVVPVVECLLDQRIVGLVQSCQSPRMLSTLVRLIENSVTGDSTGNPQAVVFLQQCGFAGMWRYAGVFLSPRASLQAINSNLCSCLECILASL